MKAKREEKKDYYTEYNKSWKENNKEHISEYNKQYRDKNKEKLAEKTVCDNCGSTVKKYDLKTHQQTKNVNHFQVVTVHAGCFFCLVHPVYYR